MISLLSKSADEIGAADIQELIDFQVPEGDQIEFKADSRSDGDSSDPWISGGRPIRDRARNRILEETVAFANAYGGALVLGIAESESRPPVAARISPISRCAELADQLKLTFRDCVDPQIPSLEIVAVRTRGDDGVVVIRVGKSRMAPHRVEPTSQCTVRRADRCEKMTMREIQDLTLNLSRGLESVERQLRRRSERFSAEFKCLRMPDKAYGIRVTAVPVGSDVRFNQVFREYSLSHGLLEPWHAISLMSASTQTELKCPALAGPWRPMLRAARNEYYTRNAVLDLQIYREINCDGLVEIGLVKCVDNRDRYQRGPQIYNGWPIVLFSNLLVWADRVRVQAQSPTVEYAVEVETHIRGEGVLIAGYDGIDLHVSNSASDSSSGSVRYPGELLTGPSYSLREQSSIADLIATFDRDFWNSVGHDVGLDERRFLIHGWGRRD